jgi:coenzyme Q-binding protein COQ10
MATHAERRSVPHSAEQMYALVADVARYPQFLPWCVGARILARERHADHEILVADLIVGFKAFRGQFTSRVTLMPDRNRVDVEYTRGPFKYLNNHWKFIPEADGGCTIDFFIDFEFKNRVFQRLIDTMFNEAVHRMVRAFEDRARALYGETPAADQVRAGASGTLPRGSAV